MDWLQPVVCERHNWRKWEGIARLFDGNVFLSELYPLKKAIPKEWYVLLSEEKSVKKLLIPKRKILFLLVGWLILEHFLQYHKKWVLVKPIGIHLWISCLKIQDCQNKTVICRFI